MSDAMSDTETKAGFARRIGCSRTYVNKLAGQGMPLTNDGRVPVEQALQHLRDHDKLPRGASAADPGVEATARALADSEHQSGQVIAAIELQSRWPALATVAAVEAGLPADQARELFNVIAAAFTEDGRRWLASRGVQAFADGDPAAWRSATIEPAWNRLGKE